MSRDIANERFGRLIAIKRVYKDKGGNYYWLCVCDCRTEKIVRITCLTSGNTKSCGCLKKEHNFIDLVGKVFSRLSVIKKVGSRKQSRISWLCKCNCGREIVVLGYNLKNGHTKSCGCLRTEKLIERNKLWVGENSLSYKHGLYGTKAYSNAACAKRYAKKLKATPNRVNKELVDFYYKIAATMSDYEVDHIQPLSKGGLHHEGNLQILLTNLNREKSNKWPLTKKEKIKYSGFKL